MAIHRLPLALNKKCSFWKLLGSGKNGTFDLRPDWQQWGLLSVWESTEALQEFQQKSVISKWWRHFTCEKLNIICSVISSHGKWSGEEPFQAAQEMTQHNGPVAVLTRATIRLNRLKNFWQNVSPVAAVMNNAQGFIASIGIGEAPVYKQATFSIWASMDDLKAFAYRSVEHSEVIKKTRLENWYSEELFARFKIISIEGTLNGKKIDLDL
ncbi:DUF3291 domain-containing protein [Pedobacter sp. HMF7647]|uniref:DUF3291 domain-containing protein n=2 Tax=Hufsiella arboris TaxID=2695275 RepID=A0A7K1YCA3_9SPHI|nr:DUF3291 domain-containing protein [Hufsiella arboris]MXV52060.1 DUF3291 domain-containing protein [Hufsiella arboris]